jgi:hypothetical protein
MDRQDLYWLAGLLEGEGSFQKPAPSEPKYPRITLRMTDLDIVQKVVRFFGRNYIHTHKSKQANHKDCYSTLVKGNPAVQLMRQLYPLMGERRKQQIEDAIGEIPALEYESTDEDWFYWLAGLLEGEGSFIKGTPSAPNKSRIHVNMTDKDVIEHVAQMMGVNAKGPFYRDQPRKPRYFATLPGLRAMEVMKRLRPLMGQRRQGQIDVVIASYAPKPHPFGDTHPQAKLNAEKVRDIKRRLAEGEKLRALAREFDMDSGLIWQIKAGRLWQHVT